MTLPTRLDTRSRTQLTAPTDVFSPVESRSFRFRLPRIVDYLWVIGLMTFIYAGMPLATFHADEAMQIYTSGDFWTLFIDENLRALETRPPYEIDSDAQLRLLNGSVNRYTIGLAWYLNDVSETNLPERPGWNWGISYDDNVRKGFRPAPELLNLSRLPSTIFLMLSIPILWALGHRAGGRVGAYTATLLVALNPAVLLNGRRALQEGSMLFFGLYTIYLAAVISANRARGRASGITWLLLSLSAGLAVASKHTGLVFVAGAAGWLVAAELLRTTPRGVLRLFGLGQKVAWMLILAAGVFFALTPALWSNRPFAQVNDLLTVRADLVTLQTELFPETALPDEQARFDAIITQPFSAPLMHYEAPSYGESAAVQQEIAAYMESPLSGLHWGEAGIFIVILTISGAAVALLGLTSRNLLERDFSAGILVSLAVVIAYLTLNPLEWQRYYLPLIPLAALLSGSALGFVFKAREQKEVLTTADVVSQYS
ncbi:MAG: phospholipid carrier-dependent glycosyltransferase [bacterium]|nr:phospholipid carrier-dependent glycosyltransferase [bacterium]